MDFASSGTRKALMAVLAVLLAALAWQHFGRLIPLTVQDHGQDDGKTAGPSVRQLVYYGPKNSLAVLPFRDLSEQQDHAYWGDGFSRELAGLLTRVPGLQVTSPTSSFFFRGAETGASGIAERLQAAHLLEGEFQLAGEQAFLTTRLIDGRTATEIWSRTFEGSPYGVFAVQDDILSAVVDNMSTVRPERLPRAETGDSGTWDSYLRGRYFLEQRTPEGCLAAEELFLAAIGAQPDFDRAWTGLAEARLALAGTGAADTGIGEAREAISRALKINPGNAQAHGLRAYILHHHDWDWNGALDASLRAVELNPGDARLKGFAGQALFTLGQFAEAEEFLQASVRQDPLNLYRRLRLGLLQEFSGNYDEALSTYRQIIGLNPDFPGAHAYRSRIKILQEKPDSAMKESEQETDPFWKRYSEILSLTASESHDEAALLLEQMIEDDGHHAAYQVTEILAFRGDIDPAFDWFRRAYDQRDGGMREIVGNRFLENLHDDPRWLEMLERMTLPLDLIE